MALKKEDAIRIEEYMPPSRQNTGRKPLPIYIFKCKTCDNDARSSGPYLKRHSGLCGSCNARVLLPKALAKRRIRPKEALYNRLKDSAKIRNHQAKILSYEEFLEFTEINTCHYCNNKVLWNKACTYNLDRKDNNKDYEKENLVVCCGDCNYTKGNRFTYEEFMLISPVLKQINLNRKGSCG